MAEGLKAWNEFDTTLCSIKIEFQKSLGVEWARVSPDFRMTSEVEGVFDVEHQDVESKSATEFD